MSANFVTLISYLDEYEAQALKKLLSEKKIEYQSNGHGGASRFRSFYYEISVSSEDLLRAKEIIGKFKVSQSLKKNKCPKCGSLLHEPVKNLGFFQKILYTGTTPVKCKKCKTLFGI